jgi:hypothetical protein
MTAVDIHTSGHKEFNDSLAQLFSDPRNKQNVDIITFNYSVDLAGDIYGTALTDDEKAEAVVDDIAAYSRSVLQKYGKPTLITKFNVKENQHWDDSNYDILFRKIIVAEDQLVKAGLIGIIYSPAIDADGYGLSDSTKPSEKKPKFCSLDRSMGLLAATNARAQFQRSAQLPSLDCTRCSSLEITLGQCDRRCENGDTCDLPEGVKSYEENLYRCPAGAIVGECPLCNATFGTYLCNLTYTNGTKLLDQAFESPKINSDVYGDVIGGLEKPNKCCLQDELGTKYSFIKNLVANAVNSPIIYPKTGNPLQDCGVTSGQTLTKAGKFCGIKLPIREYDIECVFEEKPISVLRAEIPGLTLITEETYLPFTPLSQ